MPPERDSFPSNMSVGNWIGNVCRPGAILVNIPLSKESEFMLDDIVLLHGHLHHLDGNR